MGPGLESSVLISCVISLPLVRAVWTKWGSAESDLKAQLDSTGSASPSPVYFLHLMAFEQLPALLPMENFVPDTC